jgi:glycosyltransferase involved in cell wall biosynthesis
LEVSPRFSLIVATLGRTEELACLLLSIHNQDIKDFEVILIDQNQDDRVSSVVRTLPFKLNIHHIRRSEKNPSTARNAGIELAAGAIIAFPDDDCWYPAGLLREIDAWFRSHPEYAVLAVGARDNAGVASGNRWIQSACDIRPYNALRTTFCSSLFMSAARLNPTVRFDQRLFPSEETDFILRQLATGLRGRFDRRLYVHHPRRDMLSGTVSSARARHYGAAMGCLVRRHSLYVLWAALLTYDLARAALTSVRGRFRDAGFCFAHAKGLFMGFIAVRSAYD